MGAIPEHVFLDFIRAFRNYGNDRFSYLLFLEMACCSIWHPFLGNVGERCNTAWCVSLIASIVRVDMEADKYLGLYFANITD